MLNITTDRPTKLLAVFPLAAMLLAATTSVFASDLEQLPPIDSIGPDSDVRVFLAPNVPDDLARAALRRAWTADPAIRSFVGIAENQWNDNAPGGEQALASVPPNRATELSASGPRDSASATQTAQASIMPQQSASALDPRTRRKPSR